MAFPIVLIAEILDPAGEDGLAVSIGFLHRLQVHPAPLATGILARNPSRIAPHLVPLLTPDFHECAEGTATALGAGLAAIIAGRLVDTAQAQALSRLAEERGLPLVVAPHFDDWNPTQPSPIEGQWLVPLVKTARLLLLRGDAASAVSGEAWDRSRDGLLRLARALTGPQRTVAVLGSEIARETTPMAIAGPEGETLVEAAADGRTPQSGWRAALGAACGAYLALGLSPLSAAGSAHRLVAETLIASPRIPGRPIIPAPWSV